MGEKVQKCSLLHQWLTELLWFVYQIILRIHKYRILRADNTELLSNAYAILTKVYVMSGYIDPEQAQSELKDIFDSDSTVLLAKYKNEFVGTIKITPARYFKSSIFLYLTGFEQEVNSIVNLSVEIGRFAILPSHRGGFLSIGMLLSAFIYAMREGSSFLLWTGSKSIYERLKQIIPDTRLIDAKPNDNGNKKFDGYFKKYGSVPVYIVPMCKVNINALAKYLFTEWISKITIQ